MSSKEESIFAQHAWKFIERGISVVPIAPGTKKPGVWSQEHGWRGMPDWTRFATRLPTEIELKHWGQYPESGIGVVLGRVSNLIGVDKDYDLSKDGEDALSAIIPYTPIAKKGQKGWTKFYQYNGEKSCSFDVNGARVLDILSDGRQTVIPPTVHPSGCSYIWITEDTLDSILSTNELPKLPDDFLEQVARVLAPYQTQDDVKHQTKALAHRDDDGKIDTDLSIQAQYFSELNRTALGTLDAWVPRLIPSARPHGEGYRCIATWRNVTNPNVGIHPHGIMDFGGGYGMTPLDLVMYANGLPFRKAADVLRECLPGLVVEQVTMTVGGTAIGAPNPAPIVLPWLKQAAAPVQPVMLPPTTSLEPAPAMPAFLSNPPGILGDIARWITATAPKSQPELSVAAAISLCSVVMGRTYRTTMGNYSSLYLVLVAKSGEGKEHPQSCVEKVLVEAGLANLYAGSGYTSAGAVHSALLKAPAHIVTIDEIGKLLKISRKNGQANSEAAIDKLVEAFGRCDGVMHPPVYSSMTLSKGQASNTDRVVYNPGITMLGATTPGTFYENLTRDLVKDGFLGRCIVVESKQPRQLTQLVPRTPPPERIIDWCKAVHVTGAGQGDLAGLLSSEQPPHLIEMSLDESCMSEYTKYDAALMEAKDNAEGDGMDMLLVRTLEKALRLALIVALAKNVHARNVTLEDFQWAYQYVSYYDMAMVRSVVDEAMENEHQQNVRRVLDILKRAKSMGRTEKNKNWAKVLKEGGIPHSMLLKKMHMEKRHFDSLVDTMIDAGQIAKNEAHVSINTFGFAGVVYCLDSSSEVSV